MKPRKLEDSGVRISFLIIRSLFNPDQGTQIVKIDFIILIYFSIIEVILGLLIFPLSSSENRQTVQKMSQSEGVGEGLILIGKDVSYHFIR